MLARARCRIACSRIRPLRGVGPPASRPSSFRTCATSRSSSAGGGNDSGACPQATSQSCWASSPAGSLHLSDSRGTCGIVVFGGGWSARMAACAFVAPSRWTVLEVRVPARRAVCGSNAIALCRHGSTAGCTSRHQRRRLPHGDRSARRAMHRRHATCIASANASAPSHAGPQASARRCSMSGAVVMGAACAAPRAGAWWRERWVVRTWRTRRPARGASWQGQRSCREPAER